MSDRPNLLFIMPDQLRHDFLGCYGASFVETPHIDRIAAEGVRYENAYSLHPVCVPARVALLTGLNAIRNHVLTNGNFLRPDHRECGMHTWAQMLSEQGYCTASIGKMHFYPWDLSLGFEKRIICEDKVWIHIQDDYYHFLKERGHRKYMGKEHEGYDENRGAIISKLPWDCYWDYFVGEEAARFVRDYDDERPFAAMVGFPGPHDPHDPSPEWLEKVDEETIPPAAPGEALPGGAGGGGKRPANRPIWSPQTKGPFTDAQKSKIRAHYSAQVMQIDHEVGRILAALEERGMLENTVVIFASDHGEMAGDHDMRGKGNFYEGSCHVPMLARLPGGRRAGEVRGDLVALTDVTATLLALSGCGVPDYMDSRPLPGLGLEGEAQKETLVGFLQGGWMAFDGRFKLVKYAGGFQALFDLEEDRQEQTNVIDSSAHADQCRRLDVELCRELMRSMQASHHYNQVYEPQRDDLWADEEFGEKGWRRSYPWPLKD